MFYYIRVVTDSEYKYIRQDCFDTPCRTNVFEDAKLFSTQEDAVAYATRFNLVSTFHVHEVVRTGTEKVVVTCQYVRNNVGKFVLDARVTK